jgi:putative ABC transport system permease protein
MIGLCAGLAARRPLLWMAGITASSAPGLEVLCAEAILLGIALPEVLGFAFILPAIRRRPALLLRREADFTPGRTVIPREGVFGWLVVCAVGGYFAGKALDSSALLLTGLAGGLLIVYGLFRAGFRLAHNAAGKRSLIGLPLSLRQGARNFLSAASNNQAVTVISAFVAMLTVLTGFGEAVVVREVSQSLPMAHADLYLTGFAHSQLRGIRSILDRQKDIEKPYDIRNFVWLRVGPAGQPSTSPLSLPLSLVACSTELPGGSGIVLDRNLARRFGVRAGSSLVLFGRDGETLEETVRTVRESPVAEGSWSGITIPCAPVDPLDMFHYAGLKVPEREIPALTRELNASYPALAVVSPREIFAQVTTIVGTGAALVKFVSVLSILTGLIVISALMAASARQRAHQIAVLRTLGASKWMILRILTCEFAVLGSLAGLLGGISGVLLADVALSVLLEKRIFDIHPAALGLAVSSGIVLSVVTGSLSCARFFSRRPLITLRCD